MNDKYIFGLVVIATTLFATLSIVSDVLVGSTPLYGTSMTYNTMVCKVITRANGEVIDLGCSHNLVTNDGKDFLKNCLGQGGCGANAFVTLAIANCTSGVAGDGSDSTLCSGDEYTTCDLGPAAGTYKSAGTGAWNVTYTWTASSTCSVLPVNATGLYNATSGTLLAENAFTDVTLQGLDQINVTWGIWVT